MKSSKDIINEAHKIQVQVRTNIQPLESYCDYEIQKIL